MLRIIVKQNQNETCANKKTTKKRQDKYKTVDLNITIVTGE
jgi:hypothetical protein